MVENRYTSVVITQSGVTATSFNVVVSQNSGTVRNCYYNSDKNSKNISASATGAEGKTARQFASGEVAYLLNGDQSKLVFGQTLGTDKFPVFVTNSNKVYSASKGGCIGYTNDESKMGMVVEHNIGEDGMCKLCGNFIISTAAQLKAFADHVNNVNEKTNAKLDNNIILNDSVFNEDGTLTKSTASLDIWTPIENYEGVFDGCGFTISGMYIPKDDNTYGQGLFASLGSGSTLKNLTVKDSYINGTNAEITAAIAVFSYGAITNCFSDGSCVIGSSYTGGVVG